MTFVSGKENRIFVLYGEEPYLIDEFQKELVKKAVGDDPSPFDISLYDGEETPLHEILEDAETLPFLKESKVVLVTNPYFLTGTKPRGAVEQNVDILLPYLHNPAPFTYLVFRAAYPKLDERKKIVKQLKQTAVIKHATELSEQELHQWVEKTAQKDEALITVDARKVLLERVGPSLRMLREEIRKLSLYAEGTIEASMVDELVPRTLDQNVFALMDDLQQKKTDSAMLRYHDLLRQKEDPLKLLLLLASQVRAMHQIDGLLKKGYGQAQVAKRLKLHPYRVKVLSTQLKSSSLDLSKMLFDLGQLDVQMKSGRVDKVLGFELFLLQYSSR
ncbi:DNA polymerase III subunit delta [Aureibacillus halotolerans]|uniref:DNA polymerase III subunit delta n=1 Tax=Aureibacillus halotolerans TaxID=1508390 RepID=A0A4R6TW31_9BACI|nr:DNA polymerase III subunit delta [Aureibacillus halotolerans]TDQ38040.1 DNA polymerase III delta subunit [Aureibacillus halotolerans]